MHKDLAFYRTWMVYLKWGDPVLRGPHDEDPSKTWLYACTHKDQKGFH